MRALVYAACAAFVLSLAALFLPRAKKPLPGEKTPAPAWLASLTGVFMAAGVPLFALERLASGLSADPAFLPGVSFGPLPWAFAALAQSARSGSARAHGFRSSAQALRRAAISLRWHAKRFRWCRFSRARSSPR